MARSKEFDENVVLEKAMRLFWEKGYERTSMSDLVEHMGIHRRSLYDTFGDKHMLFMKALDLFGDKKKASHIIGIERSETATQALQFMFDYAIQGNEETPHGCLFVNSAVELAQSDMAVNTKVNESFEHTEQTLKEIILWGQQKGEFTSDYDAEELAEYLKNILIGLRVMRRTSTPKEELYRSAKLSMEFIKR